jgi:hypothetical protein
VYKQPKQPGNGCGVPADPGVVPLVAREKPARRKKAAG